MRNAPAYQEYPSDLLANEDYAMMALEERGLFHSMRHHCWVNGSVSSRFDDLAILVRTTDGQVAVALTERVKAFFAPHPSLPDRLVSPELEQYRKTMEEKSEARRLAGQLSAERKKQRVGRKKLLQQRVEHHVSATPE